MAATARTRVLLGTLPGGADVLVTLFTQVNGGTPDDIDLAEIAVRDPSSHRWNPPTDLTEETD
jgi:hypothetical protein